MGSGFLFNNAFVLRKGVKIETKSYRNEGVLKWKEKTQGKKGRSMFLYENRVCDREKTLPWKQKGVGSGETRYRRPCIRICTCQITKTEIAYERPAKFSYMQNRFGRRAGEMASVRNLFDGFSLGVKPGSPTAWRKSYDQESQSLFVMRD